MKRRISYYLFYVLCFGYFLLTSCKGLQKETIVYQNNFENASLGRINGGKIGEFNGSKVIGRYSESGFDLRLDSLPKHDMVQISFDLYIHDTWDGNAAKPEGPDIWIMNIDGWSAIYATIASGLCADCKQSYPVLQPTIENNRFNFFNYKPNSNAIQTDLPGVCKLEGVKGGTVKYRILRTIEHTESTLIIGCYAQLEDPDPVNKNCNESWSVDNIKVKAIEFR